MGRMNDYPYPRKFRLYDHDKLVAKLTAYDPEQEKEIYLYALLARASCIHHQLPGQCCQIERIETL